MVMIAYLSTKVMKARLADGSTCFYLYACDLAVSFFHLIF